MTCRRLLAYARLAKYQPFGVASAIILEAGLSFLGLGVKVPIPCWGEMISAAQSPTVLIDIPWLWIASDVAIAFTVLSVNFIGDGLRDALDPRAVCRRLAAGWPMKARWYTPAVPDSIKTTAEPCSQ